MHQLTQFWAQFWADRRRSWLIAFISLVLVITGTLAMRGLPSVAEQQATTTITLLLAAQELPNWKPIIADFEAQNPDIKINAIEGPTATNLVEDLYTSAFLLGDSPYDLIYMDIVWVPKFAAAGWLLPLNDRISEAELAAFLPADRAGGTYHDQLYRLPARSDAGMLYYRQDLLDRAGIKPPNTIVELLDAAKRLQTSGQVKWGYVWQGRQYEGAAAMFVEILRGFGGAWVDRETLEVGLDRPESIAAVQFLLDTIKDGVTPPGVTTYQEEETRRLFQSGDVLFLRSWPYVWPLANAPDSKVAGKIGLKPMIAQSGYASGACQGGWGWGIAKSSRQPDAAWRVAQFFASPASQKRLTLATGYLPARRSLYSDPEIIAKYPHFRSMLTVLDAAVLRPPIAQYAQASDILQRYLSAALTERMTPIAAMQAAAAETRLLFTGGGF
jgi:multiple sugar transport system substrate-binding protein